MRRRIPVALFAACLILSSFMPAYRGDGHGWVHAVTQSRDSIRADKIISYTVDPRKQDCYFYWKDDSGRIIPR